MLVFKHNQHQIEEAKQIAKEYGFHNFTLILSNRLGRWSEPFTYKKDQGYEESLSRIGELRNWNGDRPGSTVFEFIIDQVRT